jgi:hypothetical protein
MVGVPFSWSRRRACERAGEVFAEPDPVRRLQGAAGWLAELYSAGFDVVMIVEAATDESPETRALLRSKLAGRNEVMDAMIASLETRLATTACGANSIFPARSARSNRRRGARSDQAVTSLSVLAAAKRPSARQRCRTRRP